MANSFTSLLTHSQNNKKWSETEQWRRNCFSNSRFHIPASFGRSALVYILADPIKMGEPWVTTCDWIVLRRSVWMQTGLDSTSICKKKTKSVVIFTWKEHKWSTSTYAGLLLMCLQTARGWTLLQVSFFTFFTYWKEKGLMWVKWMSWNLNNAQIS